MNHYPHPCRAATGILLCIAVLMLGSCKPKKFIYLEDMPVNIAVPISQKQETRVKPGDRLDIHVSCTKQELAMPFNNASYRVNLESTTVTPEATASEGYLVDDEGCINFPILGRLQVGELTLQQVNEFVEGLLTEGNHMPDALVDTRITNFTIYGLGALNPSKLIVPEGQINILQALAQMGDLEGRAKYKKVRVIREEYGQRTEYDLDMTTTAIFTSPAFNLQQNDIVYAEPNKKKSDAPNKAAIWISMLATIASIAYSVTYILK
jgi:polysaccharide export outer membrane protein